MVTAVTPGAVTVTFTTDYGITSNAVNVTVKAKEEPAPAPETPAAITLDSVKQTKAAKLELTFSGALTAAPTSVTITNASTSAVVMTKSVSLNAKDKTKVEVETYVSMADGKEYTVQVGDVTKSFTATDNVVASISVDPLTIQPAKLTTIKAILKDKNGVELDTITKADSVYGTNLIDFKIDVTADGYVDGDQLYLNAVGKTAVVNVTYHSGKYDTTTGAEINNVTSGNVTITAADVQVTGWEVIISNTSYANYSEAKTGTVAAGDASAFAYVRRTLENGSQDYDLSAYTVDSSNYDVMTVSKNDEANGKLTLTGNKAGSAMILVKNASGTVVTTLPVVVKAARTATRIALDKTTSTVSTATTAAFGSNTGNGYAVETDKIGMTVYDQYNEKITTEYTEFAFEKASTTAKVPASGAITSTTGGIAIDMGGKEAGAYNQKVTYKSATYGTASATFVVTAKKPSSADTTDKFELRLDSTSVDPVVTDTLTANKIVKATVYRVDKAGVAVDVATGEGITLSFVKASNSVAVTTGSAFNPNTNNAVVVSSGAITTSETAYVNSALSWYISVNDRTNGGCLEDAIYKVSANAATVSTMNGITVTPTNFAAASKTKTFTVKNTQKKATATVNGITLAAGNSLDSIIDVNYDKNTYKAGSDVIIGYTTNAGYKGDTTPTETVYIKSITVRIQIGTSENYIRQEIAINRTITVK